MFLVRNVGMSAALVASVSLVGCGGLSQHTAGTSRAVSRAATASPTRHKPASASRHVQPPNTEQSRQAGSVPPHPESNAPVPRTAAAARGQTHRVPPSPTLAAGFSVLARPWSRRDRLPPEAARNVRSSNAAHFIGKRLVAASSARRVSGRSQPGVWLLSAPRAICLLRASPPPHPAGIAYSLTCLPPAEAAAGALISSYFDPGIGRHAGEVFLAGVVPDRVHSVAVVSLGGAVTTLRVHGNAYLAYARAPHVLTYRLAGRLVTIPVPQSPGSGSAVLAGRPSGY